MQAESIQKRAIEYALNIESNPNAAFDLENVHDNENKDDKINEHNLKLLSFEDRLDEI